MKHAVLPLLAALTIAGCRERSPVQPDSPLPPGASVASLWAMVIESEGVCIKGAKVVVIGGPTDGQTVTQDLPCDAWDFGGLNLNGLTVGVETTLRASAAGYATQDFKVTATPTSYQRAFLMVLTKQ